MDPNALEILAPVFGVLIVSLLAAIPLLGLTARFAAKPIVEALVRYREVQGRSEVSEEMLRLQERRLNLLEAELQHVNGTLQRLVEAEQFRAELEAGRGAGALPRVGASLMEPVGRG